MRIIEENEQIGLEFEESLRLKQKEKEEIVKKVNEFSKLLKRNQKKRVQQSEVEILKAELARKDEIIGEMRERMEGKGNIREKQEKQEKQEKYNREKY